MNKMSFKTVVIAVLIISSSYTLAGQNGKNNISSDSLTLSSAIETAVSNHPAIKAAEESVKGAKSRIDLAKTGLYPEADFTASASKIGPVVKITIPDMGSFQLFPDYNYSASVNFRQVVYDFGRTRENIKLENENRELTFTSLEQAKQKLSTATMENFYALLFLQEAVKIKDEQITSLNSHLAFMEKLASTGSATEYQTLSTKVRISAARSQKADIEAALSSRQASMCSLLGLEKSALPVVRKDLKADLPATADESLIVNAIASRDEIKIIDRRKSLAELKYDLLKYQNKPMISFVASGGTKNGYLPYLNDPRLNYVIGFNLRVPIYDGMKTKYSMEQAGSAVTAIGFEKESAIRSVSNEIAEAEANLASAKVKIAQAELQFEQAKKAYSLAETSYAAGTITNLDLLDASTSLSESKLLLLKSRIDLAAGTYRLKAALGERLY